MSAVISIDTRRYEDVTVVRPDGRLDQESAPHFQALLDEEIQKLNGKALVLDLSKVEYISSVGLRALMIGAKSMKIKNKILVAAAMNSVVQEIFDISKFSFVIPIFASLHDAIAANSDAALKAYENDSVC